MQYISASDAKQKLAALIDTAQREPVTIRRQNRDVAIVLSPTEYQRLRGLNMAEFQSFCERVGQNSVSNGLTEGKLAELLAE